MNNIMLNLLILIYLVSFTDAYLFKSMFFKNKSVKNKLTIFEETKTMINQKNSYGFLSTISNQKKIDGYPQTSIVGYSCDDLGNPIVCLSDIAMHTNNIKTNDNVAIGINEKFFRNANDMRSTFVGDLKKVEDKEEIKFLKQKFIDSHDDAFYLNFHDFNVYKLDTKYISLNGGFGRAYNINLDKYYDAEPDLICLNSNDLVNEFNKFYSKEIKSYLDKKINEEVISYEIKKIDKYGFDIRLYLKDEYMFTKVHRVLFNKTVTEEKLKEEILTQIKIDPKLNRTHPWLIDLFSKFLFLFGV